MLKNIIAEINWTSEDAITFYTYIGIIVAVSVMLVIAAIVLRKVLEAKQGSDSSKSLPTGGDGSQFGKTLQEKYKEERDSGDFKQQKFN